MRGQSQKITISGMLPGLTHELMRMKSASARVFSSRSSRLAILPNSNFSLIVLHARPLPFGMTSSIAASCTTWSASPAECRSGMRDLIAFLYSRPAVMHDTNISLVRLSPYYRFWCPHLRCLGRYLVVFRQHGVREGLQ